MKPTTQSRTFKNQADMNLVLDWLNANLHTDKFDIEKSGLNQDIGLYELSVYFTDKDQDMVAMDEANKHLYQEISNPEE